MSGSPALQCDYDIVTVAMNTSLGTQAITGSCGGKTPKGFVIIASRATSLSSTPTTGAMLSVGVGDSSGTVRTLSCMVENGALIAAANSGRRQANDAIVLVLSTGDQTIDGSAAFSAVSADTLTIDITDAPTTAVILEVWLFYGDTLLAHCASLTASAVSNGIATATGIPFMPRFLISLGAAGGFNTSATSARMAMGFCAFNEDGSVQAQLGEPYFDRNLPTLASATGTGFRTDTITQRISVDGGGTLTEEVKHRVDNATSDGFVVTSLSGSNIFTLGYLAIYTGKLRAWVGAPSIGTTSTGDKPITDPGFRPRALFALGSKQPVANVNSYFSNSVAIHYGIGGAVAGTQASASAEVQDQSSPNSESRSVSDSTLMTILDDSGGVDWSATLVSMDKSGFTVNVGTASGSDNLLGFLALESGSERSWLIPPMRWRRQLGRM